MLIDSVARPPVAMSWHALEPALMPPPPASARKRFSPRATQIDVPCVRHLRLVSPDRAAARQRSGRAMGLCLRAWRRPSAPTLLGYETANIIRRHELAGLISPDQAAQAHADLLDLAIEHWPHDPDSGGNRPLPPRAPPDALARLAQVPRERVCSDGTHRVESACSLLVTCQFTVFVGQRADGSRPALPTRNPISWRKPPSGSREIVRRAPASDRADQDSCCQETAAPAPASAGADRHSRRRRPRCRRAARRAEVRLGRQAPVLIGHTQDDPYARTGSSYRPGR